MEERVRGDEEVDMELAMWSAWTLLLVWYLNALRGDIRGAPAAEDPTVWADTPSVSRVSS